LHHESPTPKQATASKAPAHVQGSPAAPSEAKEKESDRRDTPGAPSEAAEKEPDHPGSPVAPSEATLNDNVENDAPGSDEIVPPTPRADRRQEFSKILRTPPKQARILGILIFIFVLVFFVELFSFKFGDYFSFFFHLKIHFI
jgi:hypothetical protein